MTTLTASPRLRGRTALVTGATSGIGAAIARTLAAEGARVAIGGRDRDRAEQTLRAIRLAGGAADFVAAELGGSYAALRTFAADATAALGGRVDILINNAGIYPAPSTEDLADEERAGRRPGGLARHGHAAGGARTVRPDPVRRRGDPRSRPSRPRGRALRGDLPRHAGRRPDQVAQRWGRGRWVERRGNAG